MSADVTILHWSVEHAQMLTSLME